MTDKEWSYRILFFGSFLAMALVGLAFSAPFFLLSLITEGELKRSLQVASFASTVMGILGGIFLTCVNWWAMRKAKQKKMETRRVMRAVERLREFESIPLNNCGELTMDGKYFNDDGIFIGRIDEYRE